MQNVGNISEKRTEREQKNMFKLNYMNKEDCFLYSQLNRNQLQ